MKSAAFYEVPYRTNLLVFFARGFHRGYALVPCLCCPHSVKSLGYDLDVAPSLANRPHLDVVTLIVNIVYGRVQSRAL